jgi:hypothetical protein
MCYFSEK